LHTLADEVEIALALNLFVDEFVEVTHSVVSVALPEIVGNAAKLASHDLSDVVLRFQTAVRRSGHIEDVTGGVTPLTIKLYVLVKPVRETLGHAFLDCVFQWLVYLISARHFLACLKVSLGEAI
jgi:hypothetical protein